MQPCALQGHEVRLGVRLAVLHVLARHDELGGEEAGIVGVETVEQRLLARARHHDDGERGLLHGLEHLLCAGHLGRFGAGVEEAALLGVDVGYLLLGSLAAPVAACEDVDGRSTRAALVHVSLGLVHFKSETGARLCPRGGVVGHGVEEHAIHIEKHGLWGESLKAAFL